MHLLMPHGPQSTVDTGHAMQGSPATVAPSLMAHGGQPTTTSLAGRAPEDEGFVPDASERLMPAGPTADANHLLALLARESPAEYDVLQAELEPVVHQRDDVLHEPNAPLAHAYFPRTCVASIVRIMTDSRRVEVGTTGFEGMVGLPVFLGAESTPFQCFVQVAGTSGRMPVARFRELACRGTELHDIMQRFAQYMFDQAAQSVACNRLHAVDERCARWLLMTHDRVRRAERFPLTHEFLALMLGVRRASVSVAAERLQRDGAIRYSRGIVSVLDRARLEAASCECYQADRIDYARLLS